LLKEVAEEICTKQTYNLDALPPSPSIPQPQFILGQEWVPCFIQRYKHLKVVIERRIKSIQINRATKPVLEAWFNVYNKLV
jgi:hypothetical protein